MNRDYCIFDDKKSCNNCGECDLCDLDHSKKCDNCGKCLEMEGYDMKAIKIDDIIEDKKEIKEFESDSQLAENKSDGEDKKISESDIVDLESQNKIYEDAFDKGSIKYIDDIDGLDDMLEDEKNFKKIMHEEYPGLIKINSRKNQSK
ncbi:hypothetical protein J2Z42_000476 [Clostridium algifaecis]|uniref:Uncharacterized protein n=1 Tax=Clostridium algifaecis TaxID=1472040 RepID=A0ABS4KQQ6_9CLOT|nr:hypothetical protein [Clostridium algifaecis]MBP2031811.1 hypothetical protein [Clostridium algifaecis]